MASSARDHGGDLDRAKQTFGSGRWVDLSTGINPTPYPDTSVSRHAFNALPTRSDIALLERTAAQTYATKAEVIALAGAQAAIQLVPRLGTAGRACIVGPTYNEHAAALRSLGWDVALVSDPKDGTAADVLVIVNPNNPDGRLWSPEDLLHLRSKVGFLVVDESFGDTTPKSSIAPYLTSSDDSCLVMRSFGKFFGLAGVRLGFAITGSNTAARLRSLAGPWAVSGPAIEIGTRALADAAWQTEMRAKLEHDSNRLDALVARDKGWALVGGTTLFRTYDTPNAADVQTHLASHFIWSRIFPYSERWIRLGLPGDEEDWAQLETALKAQ